MHFFFLPALITYTTARLIRLAHQHAPRARLARQNALASSLGAGGSLAIQRNVADARLVFFGHCVFIFGAAGPMHPGETAAFLFEKLFVLGDRVDHAGAFVAESERAIEKLLLHFVENRLDLRERLS